MINPTLLKRNEQDTPSYRQAQAADPMLSRWVGASAGTGKTKVLVDRVLRLMLPRHGLGSDSATAPEKILCITYTKAAAAEMAQRIYQALSNWAVMPQDQLDEELFALSGHAPSQEERLAARRLFARTLDAPGGLKIMTVHSFCQSVLKRFPIESGVAPHFEMMDETESSSYMNDILHDMIARAQGGQDHVLSQAFATLAVYLNSEDMAQLLRKMLSKRHLLSRVLLHHGDTDGHAQKTMAALQRDLGIDAHFDPQKMYVLAANLPQEKMQRLRHAAQALQDGGKEDQKKAQPLAGFWSLQLPERITAKAFDDYLPAFFKDNGEAWARLATKAAQKIMPDIEEVLSEERDRLDVIKKKLSLWRLYQINAALLLVSTDLLARYAAYKQRMDKLDFDDLIFKTAALLSNPQTVSWVLFKLDHGIDHILLDEAQDTSPEQWRVMSAIADEFFSGQGREVAAPRTLFVVGDDKQSIFSFQGADPSEFARMQHYFSSRAQNIQNEFDIFLQHSFRSSAAVLQVVDTVFADPSVRAGVVADAQRDVVHLVQRTGQAGRVELWPILRPFKAEERNPWDLPTKIETLDNPVVRLAQKMAQTIADWLKNQEQLPSQNRAIRAGDIMVLVQKRGAMVGALLRALKEHNVPVSGIDRLVLLEDMAVQDVLAMADFALQPLDDLTLAGILKSPFIGFSEDQLLSLAAQRSGALWPVVQSREKTVADSLKLVMQQAATATPYEFFSGLLSRPCPADAISGRRGIYARLGFAAQDSLDELLNAALSFEQTRIPSLQGFVHSFRQGQAEVKREQEQGKLDQVRILTVHGSKGLQAPIVFLADAAHISYDHPKGRERLLWPERGEDPGAVPLWSPRKEFDIGPYAKRFKTQTQKQDEEYRRLLYVAMTRAEDRLYVAGTQRRNSAKDHCWHKIIARLFPAAAQTLSFDAAEIGTLKEGEELPVGKILDLPQTAPPKVKKETTATEHFSRAPLPAWAKRPPRAEPSPPQPLVPSQPDEEDPAALSPLIGTQSARYRRGTLIHRILQFLPNVPVTEQDERLERYLQQPGLRLAVEQQNELKTEILRVMRDAEFAPLFSADARAEVSLIGLAQEHQKTENQQSAPRVMAGQIDRLLVQGREVFVIDYKTNRPPPRDVKDVPVVYLKQMAAYVYLLRNIYPGFHIRPALLWTDGPFLMPLSEKFLDGFMEAGSLKI